MPAFIAENPHRLGRAFPGIRTLSFGHLGDGNVHHHVQPPAGVDGAAWLAEHGAAVSRLVYSHVVDLGGSLSAEHGIGRSEEHTSELQSLMRISYAVFCLKKKK